MEPRICSLANILLLLVASTNFKIQELCSAANARVPRNETDRLALLEFKFQISNDPDRVLNSWNSSNHHCQWPGITCDTRHQRVRAITLRGKSLLGPISPRIGNLSFLKSLQLDENRFHGAIPQEFGRLFRLSNLNLSVNTLSGEIPINISLCSELMSISLSGNGLSGKIPNELGILNKLVYLDLRSNNLTGTIPRSIGNLSSIYHLSLQYNFLQGDLPNEMGLLRNLEFLALHSNRLSGEIPPSLYNISTLTVISLPSNSFSGNLPREIGLKLPNLVDFLIAGNQFNGNIPISITNASNLRRLDLTDNEFEGQVPNNLGNLPNLQRLSFAGNFLGSNSSQDLYFVASLSNCSSMHTLAFSGNYFGGELPNSIGNLTLNLQRLQMGSNLLSGTIPVELFSLPNLFLLSMEGNFLWGAIPSEFGKLWKLQTLSLAANSFTGEIPTTLFNISSLYYVDLALNSFDGPIPQSIQDCQNLKYLYISDNKLTGIVSSEIFAMSFSPLVLDLSHNLLSGSLPTEVGRLENVNSLNVSYNRFSGVIPATLGDCSSLEYLNMEENFFQGSIPQKLASLKGLIHLDLSRNNLTGQIPRDLERLSVLAYLNLSSNDLVGEIPRKGVFGNSIQTILGGNNKLCGGIPELRLPSCPVPKKKNKKLLVVLLVSLPSLVIIASLVLLFYYAKKDRRSGSSALHSSEDKILRISFHELYHATAGFSHENLLGSGNFGFVYKGRLDQQGNRLVAIKVLDLQKNGASKSFKAECRALRHIRHRNLVALLTYCSSIDFRGHEFKALVYDFMENGSLDTWLHPKSTETTSSRHLGLIQRVNIAIDVASALDYLHNHCGDVIVHCDLKPSNILLDNDFAAHLGDFGLARLLPEATKSSSQQGTSSSIAIKGTIGYAAPEYGMGSQTSTRGDVYSYGILLLELLTGKRPTDDIFIDDLDLHSYVEMNLSEQVMQIIDPSLHSERNEDNKEGKPNYSHGIEMEEILDGSFGNLFAGKDNLQKCFISIFKIGLKCSATSPNDRMHMNEVLRQLQVTRDVFVCAGKK